MVETNRDYSWWNDTIAGYFFNEKMVGREVILYFNESVSNGLGGDVDDFIQAIKQGPDWATDTEFCRKAYQAYKDWRPSQFKYPPYVAYLACCVMAATLQDPDERWAPQAYYPRLKKLLGRKNMEFDQNHIYLMQELWADLEKWSNEYEKGRLGSFVVRRIGAWCNVGLFWAQTIISDAERKGLHKLFADSDLDPTNPPSPEVMPKILLRFGRFERRTREILAGEGDKKILQTALVALVLQELEQWDGKFTEPQTPKEFQEEIAAGRGAERHEPSEQKVFLKICLEINEFNKAAVGYLRFKTGVNASFPEDPQFTRSGDDRVWSCEEARQGWSTKIKDVDAEPPMPLDALKVDWKSGIELKDENKRIKAILKGDTVRLFVEGEDDGLPGYVESNSLQSRIRFYVACSSEYSEKIKNWGKATCGRFDKVEIKNMPEDWILFSGENATSSCDGIDKLTIAEDAGIAIKFRGGIRVDRGSFTYLKLSRPEIVVENSSGNCRVKVSGAEATMAEDGQSWSIPDTVPSGQPIEIEAVDGESRDRKTVYLTDPQLPTSFEKACRLDKFSDVIITGTSNAIARGAFGAQVDSGFKNSLTDAELSPTGLSKRIIFVGAKPGEVAHWPKDPYPTAWQPVWAIAKVSAKRWKANYCGGPKRIVEYYKPENRYADSPAIKKWKEVLWVRRKVTSAPTMKMLVPMWRKYVEAAEHVERE